MKSIYNLSLVLLFSLSAIIVSAQEPKSESIAVSGNCGMCKSAIEKAAKSAGATEANWDKEKKVLALTYPASVSAEKIQQAIAAAGYDTRDFQATDASYKKLPECCQYERKAKKQGVSMKAMSCCKEIKSSSLN